MFEVYAFPLALLCAAYVVGHVINAVMDRASSWDDRASLYFNETDDLLLKAGKR